MIRNKRRKKSNNSILLIVIIIFVLIVGITIGYSTFNGYLFVDDFVVAVRPDVKVRVTSFTVSSVSNGGSSDSVDYNVSSVLGNLVLPNSNSSVTYTVTIRNYGNTEVEITDISLPSELNDILDVTYDGYTIGDKLRDNNDSCENSASGCKLNIERTFNINVKYKTNAYNSSNTTFNNFMLVFKFNKVSWYNSCTSYSNDLKCKLILSETPYADNVSSRYVSSSSGINFNSNASTTNGLGLYYTTDLSKTEDINDDGTGERVYYYRGLVTNNFVRFDSYCWRIVKINEDGSIKLIYAGTYNNGSCPNNGSSNVYTTNGRYNASTNSNAYVGYMYGSTNATNYNATHANSTSSAIKTTLDSWYETNLLDSESYIADYPFCNDRTRYSGNGYGTQTTVYGAGGRFYSNTNNQSPQYICSQTNDKFSVNSNNGNGVLEHPIGLLTADEASYAGVSYNTSTTANRNSYLYSGNNYWLMSPLRFYGNGNNNRTANVYLVNNYGYLGSSSVSTTNSRYIRPVINLVAYTAYTSGTGTYNNPYVINGFTEEEEYIEPVVYDEWYRNCSQNESNLNCTMIANSEALSDSSINLNAVASNTNGLGLYYTNDLTKTQDTDNDGTGERVYYYRGAVTDNYLLFGGFCWRIVRTNEDGSIKIVYGGNPTNGSCPQTGTNVSIGSSSYNSSANDNAYVGYMYGTRGSSNYNATHTNTNDSTIKGVVDEWYKNNLISYASYLKDYPFCNDRTLYSGNGYGTSTSSYIGYNRLYSNKNPTLVCSQANDRFSVSSSNGNGALTYPIALLTTDEVYYSGSIHSNSNQTTFYLYTGASTWTMTPSDYYSGGGTASAYVFYINSTGEIRISNDATSNNAVRPAVSLLPTVVVTSGNGTYNSPYQIALP